MHKENMAYKQNGVYLVVKGVKSCLVLQNQTEGHQNKPDTERQELYVVLTCAS